MNAKDAKDAKERKYFSAAFAAFAFQGALPPRAFSRICAIIGINATKTDEDTPFAGIGIA